MTGDEFDRHVAPVRELIAKKGQDYNTGVQLADYFPFGRVSYVQMIHLKATRLRSLIEATKGPNFDSVQDTLQDLLAYTVFMLAYETVQRPHVEAIGMLSTMHDTMLGGAYLKPEPK